MPLDLVRVHVRAKDDGSSPTASSSHPPPPPRDPKNFSDGPAENHKICFFRCSLVALLLLFGALIATFSYYFIHEYEDRLYREEFDSLARQIFVSVDKGLSTKMAVLVHFSSLMGFLCPQSTSWPNCSMSSAIFESLTSPLLSASDARAIGVSPLLHLEQKEDFEKFAYDYFDSDGGLPPGTGLSPFKGIYKIDNTGQRVRDLTGETNFSAYPQLFVPIFQVSDLPNNYRGVMFNMHSELVRSQAIDATLNCVKDRPKEGSGDCTSISDTIQLVSDRQPSPASILYSPIFPSQDNTTAVGMTTLIFNWVNLLSFEIPFGCSIYCLLKTDTVEHIFLLHGQTATYLGSEMTDEITSTFARDSHLKQTVIQRNELLTTTEYVLKLIPHHNFYEEYHSPLPILACVTCSLIVLVISVIFFLFDFFSKREAAKSAALLVSKRIFVRLISHEIRSPLNTIALGLEVLREKVLKFHSPQSSSSLPLPGRVSSSDPSHEVSECLEVIRELTENSEAAVVVLNDLINYDKIELKTFAIDKREIDLERLIDSTCRSLLAQAKKKNIALTLQIDQSPRPSAARDPPVSNEEGGLFQPQATKARFVIDGDSVKLTQVFQNVISNALKLTPNNGKVSVEGLTSLSVSLSFSLSLCQSSGSLIEKQTPSRFNTTPSSLSPTQGLASQRTSWLSSALRVCSSTPTSSKRAAAALLVSGSLSKSSISMAGRSRSPPLVLALVQLSKSSSHCSRSRLSLSLTGSAFTTTQGASSSPHLRHSIARRKFC
jgi:signal transduction histidine kinase